MLRARAITRCTERFPNVWWRRQIDRAARDRFTDVEAASVDV
jgi:hypothetical protein